VEDNIQFRSKVAVTAVTKELKKYHKKTKKQIYELTFEPRTFKLQSIVVT